MKYLLLKNNPDYKNIIYLILKENLNLLRIKYIKSGMAETEICLSNKFNTEWNCKSKNS
jgi:hypothetical protein